MHIFKKITGLLSVLSLAAGLLIGCGKSNVNSAEKTTEKTTEESMDMKEAVDTTTAVTEMETDSIPSLIGSAVVPEVSVERRDVPDTDAFRFVQDMKIGMSLGNTFDAYSDSGLKDEMDSETVWQSMPTSSAFPQPLPEKARKDFRMIISERK